MASDIEISEATHQLIQIRLTTDLHIGLQLARLLRGNDPDAVLAVSLGQLEEHPRRLQFGFGEDWHEEVPPLAGHVLLPEEPIPVQLPRPPRHAVF